MSPRDAMLILRVDAEVKQRIADAARKQGRSITDFMLKATLETVARVERTKPEPPSARKGGACPAFFKSLCATATSGGPGYEVAGHELTRHIADLGPHDLDPREWQERLDALEGVLLTGDDPAIVEWFRVNTPRCMELVPSRRVRALIAGVRRYFDEHETLR